MNEAQSNLIEYELAAGVQQVPRLLVGVKDAAAMLGISERSVWKLSKEEQLTPLRIGNRTLWSVRELEDWVEEQLDQATGNS